MFDKYNYDNMNFPAGYEDIETFENNKNKVLSAIEKAQAPKVNKQLEKKICFSILILNIFISIRS